jgi:hypothetical protein
MQVDTAYLRRQYNSLSDEALLAIQRADLVEAAQRCYDAELDSRGLTPASATKLAAKKPGAPPEPDNQLDQNAGRETYLLLDDGEEPDWLPDAAEVLSAYALPGQNQAADLADARSVLEAEGIPCHLEALEEVNEPAEAPIVRQRIRLLVPGEMNLHATSILDRDLLNKDFETEWRAHLDQLTDEQLRAMPPEQVFCGLYDRIERINRVYDEELARRGLEAEPT